MSFFPEFILWEAQVCTCGMLPPGRVYFFFLTVARESDVKLFKIPLRVEGGIPGLGFPKLGEVWSKTLYPHSMLLSTFTLETTTLLTARCALHWHHMDTCVGYSLETSMITCEISCVVARVQLLQLDDSSKPPIVHTTRNEDTKEYIFFIFTANEIPTLDSKIFSFTFCNYSFVFLHLGLLLKTLMSVRYFSFVGFLIFLSGSF